MPTLNKFSLPDTCSVYTIPQQVIGKTNVKHLFNSSEVLQKFLWTAVKLQSAKQLDCDLKWVNTKDLVLRIKNSIFTPISHLKKNILEKERHSKLSGVSLKGLNQSYFLINPFQANVPFLYRSLILTFSGGIEREHWPEMGSNIWLYIKSMSFGFSFISDSQEQEQLFQQIILNVKLC